jgi:lipid II:glycine glycyltransferase (peptidoglycan interpeptide bridge formation enzyme)
MVVEWDHVNEVVWNNFHARYQGSLQQSWKYGQAFSSLGLTTHRAVIYRPDGCFVGVAQFQCRRFAGYLTISSCCLGPVWCDEISITEKNLALKKLKEEIPVKHLRVTLFSPDNIYEDFCPRIMSGFTKVMSGPSTSRLDLCASTENIRSNFSVKWRNRLVSAENQSNVVKFCNGINEIEWIITKELEQRIQSKFYGLPKEFIVSLLGSGDLNSPHFLLAIGYKSKIPIAGMLFLIYGHRSTYFIGWSDHEAKKMNLNNLVLWESVKELKRYGIKNLDLGGVNTESLPGISRFKMGMNGQIISHPGTFI